MERKKIMCLFCICLCNFLFSQTRNQVMTSCKIYFNKYDYLLDSIIENYKIVYKKNDTIQEIPLAYRDYEIKFELNVSDSGFYNTYDTIPLLSKEPFEIKRKWNNFYIDLLTGDSNKVEHLQYSIEPHSKTYWYEPQWVSSYSFNQPYKIVINETTYINKDTLIYVGDQLFDCYIFKTYDKYSIMNTMYNKDITRYVEKITGIILMERNVWTDINNKEVILENYKTQAYKVEFDNFIMPRWGNVPNDTLDK